MTFEIINLKLYDDRIVQFINMNVKLYDNFDDYNFDRNYRYATEEDYNKAVADSEVKLYYLLSQANIRNPEVLTETERNIIEKFYQAFSAIDDQYQSFDSSVNIINKILQSVFGRYVSIW